MTLHLWVHQIVSYSLWPKAHVANKACRNSWASYLLTTNIRAYNSQSIFQRPSNKRSPHKGPLHKGNLFTCVNRLTQMTITHL